MKRTQQTGLSAPLGATLRDGGANFSVVSRGATGMELLFFDAVNDATGKNFSTVADTAVVAAGNTSLQSQRQSLGRDMEAATARAINRLFVCACVVVSLVVVLATLAALILRGYAAGRGISSGSHDNANLHADRKAMHPTTAFDANVVAPRDGIS